MIGYVFSTDRNEIPVVSLVDQVLRRIEARKFREVPYQVGLIEVAGICCNYRPGCRSIVFKAVNNALKAKNPGQRFRTKPATITSISRQSGPYIP